MHTVATSWQAAGAACGNTVVWYEATLRDPACQRCIHTLILRSEPTRMALPIMRHEMTADA